ncbi:hypothetical protein [Methanosarcina sp. MSH10X1]|uniref:hypothetical protein n=1 Tax=Methanosarcina sp. MSH10X1 TaxID=2507075 RepID=UPI0013E2F28C|nr:hypothetical protein [Methanosarcina sp. MSH10X1]
MPHEENERIITIKIKEGSIQNLEIEGIKQKPLIMRNVTLKNVRLIIRLPPQKKN